MHFYDPLYGKMTIAEELAPIATHPAFTRLQTLRQLGLCYLSFPGGNHTRFEHSLGTALVARRIAADASRGSKLKQKERTRLIALSSAAAICHDIGHGPFSHMTENALHGLGLRVTHEEVGAALVMSALPDQFKGLGRVGVTPRDVVGVMLHDGKDDPLYRCASTWVSSDLDADRIDYLNRDLYYTRGTVSPYASLKSLGGTWELESIAGEWVPVLTDRGRLFAEAVLLLRRENYRSIVFETGHMAATGMFEKALLRGSQYSGGEVSEIVSAALDIGLDVTDPGSIEANLPALLGVYGLSDAAALRLLAKGAGPDAAYLAQKIRIGDVFRTVCRIGWKDLHFLAREVLLGLHEASAAFSLRRSIERSVAETTGIDALHLVVHFDRVRSPFPLSIGVSGGGTLADCSGLGAFFAEDYFLQYSVECFLDVSASPSTGAVCREFEDLFKGGQLAGIA